eukprot:CAMPEP_0196664896 /NCGR_PEP_ID=MMETSP1086-20130531/58824_1 /TAXON_ID=77921 /ORGANISM="Cyanoptyche  gloeocystis , Strain SAG4.97" /LENGTH=638 /DNA_ID=CAMNT_0042001389 /DNA_START=548 /DNA_END=2466 /DNA_ORIENTATION=-
MSSKKHKTGQAYLYYLFKAIRSTLARWKDLCLVLPAQRIVDFVGRISSDLFDELLGVASRPWTHRVGLELAGTHVGGADPGWRSVFLSSGGEPAPGSPRPRPSESSTGAEQQAQRPVSSSGRVMTLDRALHDMSRQDNDPSQASSHRQVAAAGNVVAYETFGRSRRTRAFVCLNGEVRSVREQEQRSVAARLRHTFTSMYMPVGFPHSVSPDYVHFTRWQFVQNMAASMISVLSTQALLRAVGLRARGAITGAATLNWVLKDGMGRIGAMLFGSIFGNCFDNDPKRWRLAGDALYDFGLGLELLAPLVPAFFLITASTANAAKTISYMMRLPPRAAIFRSFALRENLGDISAKYNSQEVAANLLGMALGILLSAYIGASTVLPFVAYALLCSLHLYSNYRSLKNLRLPTLNRQRLELIIEAYLEQGRILSPERVNNIERILYLPTPAAAEPIVLGASLAQAVSSASELCSLLKLYRKERYLINVCNGRVFAVIHDDATTRDILMCYLQAMRLWSVVRGGPSMRATSVEQLKLLNRDRHLDESYAFACDRFDKFLRGLNFQGWTTAHLLFEPPVRVTWSEGVIAELCPEVVRPEPQDLTPDEIASSSCTSASGLLPPPRLVLYAGQLFGLSAAMMHAAD